MSLPIYVQLDGEQRTRTLSEYLSHLFSTQTDALSLCHILTKHLHDNYIHYCSLSSLLQCLVEAVRAEKENKKQTDKSSLFPCLQHYLPMMLCSYLCSSSDSTSTHSSLFNEWMTCLAQVSVELISLSDSCPLLFVFSSVSSIITSIISAAVIHASSHPDLDARQREKLLLCLCHLFAEYNSRERKEDREKDGSSMLVLRCLQQTMINWLREMATPAYLLSAPHPCVNSWSPSHMSTLLPVLADGLNREQLLPLLVSLIQLLFGERRAEHCMNTDLLLPSMRTNTSVGRPCILPQTGLFAVLLYSHIPLADVLDMLLPSVASSCSLTASDFGVTISFLSTLLFHHPPPNTFSDQLTQYIAHYLNTPAPSSFGPVFLSKLCCSLNSRHAVLFNAVTLACVQWKDQHTQEWIQYHHTRQILIDRQEAGTSSSHHHHQQIASIISGFALSHRTLRNLFHLDESGRSSTQDTDNAGARATVLCPTFYFDSWRALVGSYASCPCSFFHNLQAYVSKARQQLQTWRSFLLRSLSPALFLSMLSIPCGSTAHVYSPLPQPLSDTFHSFCSLLNELVLRRLDVDEIIESSLSPPSTSLSQLLTSASAWTPWSAVIPIPLLQSELTSLFHYSHRSHRHLLAPQAANLLSFLQLCLSLFCSLNVSSLNCLLLIQQLNNFSVALSNRVVVHAINQHMRHPLAEHDDLALQARMWSKGTLLSLMLCQELHVDIDEVFDHWFCCAYVHQLMQWLTHDTEKKIDTCNDSEHALPVYVGLVSYLLSNVEADNSLKLSSTLLSAYRLMQMLSCLMVVESPLHVAHHCLPLCRAEVNKLVKQWSQQVRQVVDVMSVRERAGAGKACVCDERQLSFSDNQEPLCGQNDQPQPSAAAPLLPMDSLLRSSSFECFMDHHRLSTGAHSLCSSVIQLPFHCWWRWMVVSAMAYSFSATKQYECYQYICRVYQPVGWECLLYEAIFILLQMRSHMGRAREQVFPPSTVSLLVERLVLQWSSVSAAKSVHPHWLLQCVLKHVLSSASSEQAGETVSSVFVSVPAALQVLLTPTHPLPIPLLSLLFARIASASLLCWTLQAMDCYSSQQQQAAPLAQLSAFLCTHLPSSLYHKHETHIRQQLGTSSHVLTMIERVRQIAQGENVAVGEALASILTCVSPVDGVPYELSASEWSLLCDDHSNSQWNHKRKKHKQRQQQTQQEQQDAQEPTAFTATAEKLSLPSAPRALPQSQATIVCECNAVLNQSQPNCVVAGDFDCESQAAVDKLLDPFFLPSDSVATLQGFLSSKPKREQESAVVARSVEASLSPFTDKHPSPVIPRAQSVVPLCLGSPSASLSSNRHRVAATPVPRLLSMSAVISTITEEHTRAESRPTPFFITVTKVAPNKQMLINTDTQRAASALPQVHSTLLDDVHSPLLVKALTPLQFNHHHDHHESHLEGPVSGVKRKLVDVNGEIVQQAGTISLE